MVPYTHFSFSEYVSHLFVSVGDCVKRRQPCRQGGGSDPIYPALEEIETARLQEQRSR